MAEYGFLASARQSAEVRLILLWWTGHPKHFPLTILLDGETNPHAIRGHNVEDDFGYSWGFNNCQSRWIGSPYHVNRKRTDQDGVAQQMLEQRRSGS